MLSEARHALLADAAPTVSSTCNLAGVCMEVNEGIAQQRGFGAEEFLGKPLYAYLPDASILLLREMLAECTDLLALETSAAPLHFEDSVEYQAFCGDGSLIWLHSTLTLLRAADGRPAGFRCLTRALSAREPAEGGLAAG